MAHMINDKKAPLPFLRANSAPIDFKKAPTQDKPKDKDIVKLPPESISEFGRIGVNTLIKTSSNYRKNCVQKLSEDAFRKANDNEDSDSIKSDGSDNEASDSIESDGSGNEDSLLFDLEN